MQPFYVDYMKNLEELHNEILRNISGLPQEALDWRPFSGGNSLSVLVVHLTGAERMLYSEVVAGVPSGRDRDSEFKVKNLELEDLTARLHDSRTFAAQVLDNLDMDDLATDRLSSIRDQKVSIAWALEHALKHTAIHLGHIQITRQLWDMQ